MPLDENTIYEELGRNYRFRLTWRYGIVTAFFLLTWGAISLSVKFLERNCFISGLILILTSLILIGLWVFDCRNRDIYRAYFKPGKKLEDKIVGTFTISDELSQKIKVFQYSAMVDAMFILLSVTLTTLGLTFILKIIYLTESSELVFDAKKIFHLLLSIVGSMVFYTVWILFRKQFFVRSKRKRRINSK